jgi:hypothetical protein
MVKSMKKVIPMMMMALVLALVMAIPAFAATQSYTFNQPDGSPSHASAYIVGDADVSGSTISITLAGNYYPSLYVDGYGYATKSVSGGNTTFTFSGSTTSDIDLTLHIQIVTPNYTHDEERDIVLHWT